MDMKRMGASLMAGVLITGMLAGCGGQAEEQKEPETAASQIPAVEEPAPQLRDVTLKDGTVIRNLPQQVDRIAALFGPSYEKLVVLNAEDKIVLCSTSHKEKWPWSALVYDKVMSEDLPAVSNANNALNVESLIDHDLDVVFYWKNEEVLKALDNIGLVGIPYGSSSGIGAVKDDLRAYAEILNTDEAMEISQRYDEYFDERVDHIKSVADTIPDDQRKTVYLASRKILASGMQQSMTELIEAAGGIPVELNENHGMPGSAEIDAEQLMAWDPDVIFLDHALNSVEALEAELFDVPTFANLKAVQNKTAYPVPVGAFYWDSGVQKILMLQWMAKQMYPDHFADFDMTAELQNFYKEFFRCDLTREQADMILASQDPA